MKEEFGCITPVPGYILETKRLPLTYLGLKKRKEIRDRVAYNKKKLQEDLASGKVKIEGKIKHYDTIDSTGQAIHIERRGSGFYGG